jgi:hypothetical protein
MTNNKDIALIPAQVLTLARRIKALVEKGDRAADKAEQFYKAAGLHNKDIKEQSDGLGSHCSGKVRLRPVSRL